jgi:hypothetical protein
MHLDVDRQYTYLGVEYQVVQALDNDLLLVVNKEDLNSGKYPLQTFVIPEK